MNNIAQLLVPNKENKLLLVREDKCDKIDYITAVGCGVVGGIIDVFLVGTPGESKLCKWTDEQANNVVKLFAKKLGWSPKEKNVDNVRSAIGFLERKFKVNYDQSVGSSASSVLGITPSNHHMKSLAHSPDIIGLFFSILNQFTSTSTFLSDGKLITMDTETFELMGNNFISKLFCGFCNWIGHLLSDFAGSSGTKDRGKGIVMPFYELFGACNFGSFSDGKGNRATLAEIATNAFTEGYDARFGLAMAIPVVITDLSIRFIWALRRYFQMRKPLKECIPISVHSDLRIMFLIGNGTLCVIDGIDAGIRSGGNFMGFFMRLNLVAWVKLTKLVIKEVLIQVGINIDIDEEVAAFKRINEAMVMYLKELEKIDIEAYRKEVEKYHKFNQLLSAANSEEEMNKLLIGSLEKMGFELPWKGDFNEFMSNKNNRLVFS